jgi:hypothetical protein
VSSKDYWNCRITTLKDLEVTYDKTPSEVTVDHLRKIPLHTTGGKEGLDNKRYLYTSGDRIENRRKPRLISVSSGTNSPWQTQEAVVACPPSELLSTSQTL